MKQVFNLSLPVLIRLPQGMHALRTAQSRGEALTQSPFTSLPQALVLILAAFFVSKDFLQGSGEEHICHSLLRGLN